VGEQVPSLRLAITVLINHHIHPGKGIPALNQVFRQKFNSGYDQAALIHQKLQII